MNYYEVNFNYESAIEPSVVSDILAAELGEIGFESFTETDEGLQAYIQDKLYSEIALKDSHFLDHSENQRPESQLPL